METKLFKTIKWVFFSVYLLGIIIILGEAAIPSKQSAQQSNAVGSVIKNLIDSITNTKTEHIAVKDIFINEIDKYDNASLSEGTKFTLSAKVEPSTASNKSVSWKTSDDEIAVINSNGEVLLKKVGIVTISLTSSSDESIVKKLTINVTEAPITALKINNNNAEIVVGKTYNLTSTITPLIASYHKITWKVLDTSILSINENGTIKALKEGTTKVIAEVKGIKSELDIVVLKDQNSTLPKIPLESLTLLNVSNTNDVALYKNIKLTYDVYPKNAYDTNVIWESSNNDIISVDQNGTIYAKKTGSVTITIKSATNKTIKSSLVVNAINTYPSKISIASKLGTSVKTLNVHSSGKLEIALEGDYTTDLIEYSSSDTNIATIDHNGVIVALGAGETEIKATIGNETLSFKLSVLDPSPIKNQTQFLLIVRKGIGHFGAFFCLGLAAILTMLCFFKYIPSAFLLSIVQGFVIAALSELIQAVTPGRFCTWNDIIIDFSGFMAAICLVVFIIILIKFIIWLIRTFKKERNYNPYALHPKRIKRKRY